MFNTTPVLSFRIPAEMESKFDFVQYAILISLGVMFLGMFSSGFYQYMYSMKTVTLMESPWPMQAMMVGGFLSFLSMLMSFVALLIWCDLQEFVFKRFARN